MRKIRDFFRKKRAHSPQQRVNAFILHWHKQWSTAQRKMGKDVDFEYWWSLVSEVDRDHFVGGRGSDSKGSFGSDPEFDPKCEKITECDVKGNYAQIFTEKQDGAIGFTDYHVYELLKGQDGNWLISSVFTLLYPPKDSVIDRDKHANLLALSTHTLDFVDCQPNLDLNENTLFQNNRSVVIPSFAEGATEVMEIGRLKINSGVIGIMDFGYDVYEFEPLHRKVEPGDYSVEVVKIHERVAGIKVRLSEKEIAVKWYAANTPSGNGVYGVDAANLAIFDVQSFLGLSRIDKEKLFSEWCLSGQAKLVSMVEHNDCVISPSGFGDGAYPAFWGVNENQQIVSLYIDFMILVKESKDGVYVSV